MKKERGVHKMRMSKETKMAETRMTVTHTHTHTQFLCIPKYAK